MKEFEELGIKNPLLGIIEKEFSSPTEIQEKTIPPILKGLDVIGGSETGSGKTLAFSIGIIQNTEIGKGIQSLVLTPTRELAEQIAQVFRKFSKHKNLEVVFIYGGVSISKQIEKLKTADMVVGTPGRILDHLGRRTINLRNIKTLVIDEADRMFDMGFLEDVQRIIRSCPRNRQTLLFSATITGEVQHLCKKHMKNPVKITTKSYVDPKKLKQVYYDVPPHLKFSLLVHLLKKEKRGLVMVFCNSRKSVNFVSRNLKRVGIEAQPIHGGFAQNRRSRTMHKFNSMKIGVLVCTDVAARGLDIKGVSHIYNYEIPRESKQYLHRIGRTARAGKEGIAVNILSQAGHADFTHILQDYDINIARKKTPQLEVVEVKKPIIRKRPYKTKTRSSNRFRKRKRF
jgi:ATP-dependent RNA helicase DeaD